jgi:hypothetical protein
MPEQKKQKCTKSRRPATRTASYQNVRHPENMLRRAKRVFKRTLRLDLRTRHFGEAKAHARAEALKCARAHGALVATKLEVWLKHYHA